MISPRERERYERFRHEPSRVCYLTTRRLIREVMSSIGAKELDYWRFRTGDKGRPFLKNATPAMSNVDFNIAHSRELVVVAVTRSGRVGVDLEPAQREVDHEAVARRFFSDVEREDLEKLEETRRHRRFLELWVLKEAWLKADGRGISAGLHRVVFRFDAEGHPHLKELPDDDPQRWEVELHQINGDHLLGLAWHG